MTPNPKRRRTKTKIVGWVNLHAEDENNLEVNGVFELKEDALALRSAQLGQYITTIPIRLTAAQRRKAGIK